MNPVVELLLSVDGLYCLRLSFGPNYAIDTAAHNVYIHPGFVLDGEYNPFTLWKWQFREAVDTRLW
jgi:hypothetical protein